MMQTLWKFEFYVVSWKNIRIIGNEIKKYVMNTDLEKLQIDTFQYLLLWDKQKKKKKNQIKFQNLSSSFFFSFA